MCCGTEAGSYLRLTQLKAQGPSRTCEESKEEEEEEEGMLIRCFPKFAFSRFWTEKGCPPRQSSIVEGLKAEVRPL